MSRSRKHNEFWKSAIENDASYMEYYNRLVELSISMFDWKNVPDTVDTRFLELALFSDGQAVFFKDEVMGYLALRCACNGPFNVYNIPINRRAYASNGYNMTLTQDDSVLIYNNYIRTNSKLTVLNFAKRLYNIDRAIDINVNAQKTPILIQCTEEERLSMENLYMKYDGNQPVIFGDKALNAQGLKVLSTDAKFVAQDLYQLRTEVWNEVLTYLGIDNVNVIKKERLISDEVMKNQGGTVASRISRLASRNNACDKINEMFGLNMSVEYKQDIDTIIQLEMQNNQLNNSLNDEGDESNE